MRAVESLLEGEHGVMIGLDGRDMTPRPLEEVCSQHRHANLDYYEMAKVLS